MPLPLPLLTACREPDKPAEEVTPTSPTACAGEEVPYDGLDNDCDPRTPDDDLDGDGILLEDDCDDQHSARGEDELFGDGVDNDCDGAVDCEDEDLAEISPAPWLEADGVATFCEERCSRRVIGFVSLIGTDLVDLSALSCLTSVGFDFVLEDNDALVSLAGLERLQEIQGALTIQGNDALTSLDGLGSLTELENELIISDNAALGSLSGLQALTTLTELTISDNPSLQTLEGLGLVSLPSTLISGNDALTSLSALSTVQQFDGDFLSVAANPSLTSLAGLEGLALFDGRLSIAQNDGLVSLQGLENLQEVGNLDLLYNDALASLAGLENLREITSGSLTLNGNDALTSLAGLENLREIDRRLLLGFDFFYGPLSNAALTDVGALYGLERVGGDVMITVNEALTYETAQALVDQIEDIGGSVSILEY